MAATATDVAPRISLDDFRRRYESNEPVTVLDARSAKAWDEATEKIQGAIRIDPDHFRPQANWPKDRLTVAYCT
jgi:rhodanese-related sulfurtransferase